MLKILLIKLSLISIFCCLQPAFSIENIDIYTEYLPPHQFIKNNKVSGKATEKVKSILQCSNMNANFYLLPWTRSFQLAHENKNSLIYSMHKNSSRLNQFHWIGLLVDEPVYIYSLKKRSDIHLNNLEELKNYHLGLYFNDFITQHFMDKGYKIGQNYTLFKRINTQINMFLAERFDLTVAPDGLLEHHIKNDLHRDPSKIIKKVRPLDIHYQLYLAANINTDKSIINKLDSCYQKLFSKPIT